VTGLSFLDGMRAQALVDHAIAAFCATGLNATCPPAILPVAWRGILERPIR
jgi:hypothetical protein